jgi:hypothetical protein
MYTMMDAELRYTLLEEALEIFTEEVETWEGYEKYVPKLKEFAKTYTDRAVKVYQPNGYCVMNHSDHHGIF